MGKLAIISDLHADINHLENSDLMHLIEVLQEKEITRLHLAGDTANKVGKLLEVVQFIESFQIPVTYNFGNHEMPSISSEEIEHYPDSHFLNGRSLPLNKNKVLLAFNGWYDYSYSTETNEKKILMAKNLYWYDRFIERGAEDPIVTQQLLEEIASTLDQLKQENKEVIIATHFVPRRDFIVYLKGKYQRFNELNAFLGSEKTGELFDKYDNIQQVVFGHTHRRFENEEFHGTLYSCRPFGYYFEWWITRNFVLNNHYARVFNPMKMRQILKEHQDLFDDYKRQHLKEEFYRALTIVEY